MKTHKFYSLFFLFMFLTIPNCQSQLLKKLKTAVTQATEQGLQKKSSQESDSVTEGDQESEKQTESKISNFLKGGEKIPVADAYNFNTNVIYAMETVSDGKPVNMDYSLWFSSNESYMGMAVENTKTETDQNNQMPGMLTILDEGNQAMIIIMEEQKVAQLMSMESMKKMAKDIKEEDLKDNKTDAYKVQKTGKSKKILGYTADEFQSQTDDGKINYWITQDIKFYQKNMFYSMNQSMGGNNFELPEYEQGFLLEMYFVGTAKDNIGDTMTMTIKDIQKKNKTITMADYRRMNLSGLMKN